MKMVIKHVAPVSLAKVAGILYALLGLFIGACVSLLALTGGFASNFSSGAGIAALFGVGSIVLFPLLYGVFGFLAMLVMAWLYNLAAGWVGGVNVDLQ